MELLEYLGMPSVQDAKNRLKEHLGENGGKCDWGNENGDRGGHLGAARRRIKQLETQAPPTDPPTVTGWRVNGLQVRVGDKIYNYEKA